MNFILLFLARLLDSVSPFTLNLSQIFLGIFTLIYLPIFLLSGKGKANTTAFLIILFIVFSPFYYLLLDVLDDTRLISSHSELDKFISYSSYAAHALGIYACLSNLSVNLWSKINKFIFYIGIVISIEAIIFYYVFPNVIPMELIAPKGKFVSLLLSDNVLCSIVATLLYVQSIISFRYGEMKSNFKLLICVLLAFILLWAAGERSSILAFGFLNLLAFFL